MFIAQVQTTESYYYIVLPMSIRTWSQAELKIAELRVQYNIYAAIFLRMFTDADAIGEIRRLKNENPFRVFELS